MSIAKVTIAQANTPVTWAPPANCIGVGFKPRTAVDVRVATVAGVVDTGDEAGGNYFTLVNGTAFNAPHGFCLNTQLNPLLYFAAAGAVVVELVVWTKVTA
jgi:hypothetical protein